MQFELIHHGNPVPFTRPRFHKGRGFNDPRYENYKKALAGAIYGEFFPYIQPAPEKGSPERSRFLNFNRFNLEVKAYRAKNTGDVDNYIKTVQDALQDSGLILDDSQIDKVVGEKFIDKFHPRIEFVLTQTQSWEQFKLAIGKE